MSAGLTRSENIALVSVILLLVTGIGIRSWRAGGDETPLLVDPDPRWEAVDLNAPNEDDSEVAEPSSSSANLPPANPDSPAAIDINSADETKLDRLPGIGESKARAIIQYREQNGLFASLDDLENVSGIGPSTLEKLRPYAVAKGGDVATKLVQPIVHQPDDSALSDTKPAALPERINVNTADFEELQKITGIGPALAQRIIDHRTHQPFLRPEDLIKVKGIGPTTFEKMRPMVAVR